MKVYIKGRIYDSDNTPIVIIMKDDDEVKTHSQNLANFQKKPGKVRMYSVSKKGQRTPEFMEKLFDKIEDKLNINKNE